MKVAFQPVPCGGNCLDRDSRAFNKPLFALFVICGLTAVFYLPYYVPVSPSASDSYLFGYSNRAGIILFLLVAAACAIWTLKLDFPFSTERQVEKVPFSFLAISSIVQLVACIGMYKLAGRFGGFAEADLEINRVWHLSIGRTPYINFDWTHGYIDLFGPYWISRLFHLSIARGYYAFWVLYFLLGTCLVFLTLNLIDYPCRYKPHYFVFNAVGALLAIPNMGSHYTAVRYTAPLVCVLLVYRFKARQNTVQAGVLAVVFTAILFAISPEVAISHAFACTILLFPFKLARSSRSEVIAFFFAVLSFGLLFLLAVKLHIMDYMLAAASGGASFPMMPAPHILFFFAVVFLCFAYVARRVTRKGFSDNTIALILFSIPMTFAALERCDPGHVSQNGAGFCIAAFFYASSTRWMRELYFAFLVFGIFVGALFNSFTLGPLFSARQWNVPEVIPLQTIYRTADFGVSDPALLVPFGYKPNGLASYQSTQIEYGFYNGLNAVATPKAVQAKIDELAQRPNSALLLSKGYAHACETNPRAERLVISLLFAFPYRARAAHPESIFAPMCTYIQSNYVQALPPTSENYDYGLWIPKTDASQLSGVSR